jgi:RNA polymerase sigma-70 factor (ECF subfamily)
MTTSQNEVVTRLYKEYRDKVYHYAYSKLGSHSEAEDLVSDIFVKILKGIDTYDPCKAGYSTWIYTIARNTVCNYLRGKGRWSTGLDEICEVQDSSLLPEEVLLRNENLDRLAELLESLPERERDIIILRFYNNYTPQQIAELVGVGYSNVKVIQMRVLSRLRKILST